MIKNNVFKTNSLEHYLYRQLSLLVLPLLLTVLLVTWHYSWPWWGIVAAQFFIAIYAYRLSAALKAKVLQSYQRASLQLDAIAQEDYKLYAKPSFNSGQVADFNQQLNTLSSQLQLQKSRYDQHVFLVYQLIGQLDSPVLVFNAKQQLTFANEAFYQLKNQPWQLFRHATPQLLGLTKQQGNQWHFSPDNSAQTNEPERWQIKQSEFIDLGEQHLLLVFVDIQSALRASQLNAWQQIIRVLGHEIRNSLTPVSSLAESLADKSSNDRDKMALTVITERCLHLQSFVERYASLSKQLSLNCQKIVVDEFFAPLIALYHNNQVKPLAQDSQFNVQVNANIEFIYGDNSFLAQVFINLLKNAKEANATLVEISLVAKDNNTQVMINVTDNGHGFSNLENLFVPLYSTKEHGQGIGLSFCRNIIEQHHGQISLVNNTTASADKKGVTVSIHLPINSGNSNT